MTIHGPEARLRDWLEAETAGDESAADAALAGLFAELPAESPSAAFAPAVLARLHREPVPAPLAAGRWAAALLALLSAGTLGLSIAAVTLLPRLAVGGAVATFNAAVAATWEWIASGIALWGRAAEWSELLARIVAVPGIAGSLFAATVAAAVAFSLLRRILSHDSHEKELLYVPHR